MASKPDLPNDTLLAAGPEPGLPGASVEPVLEPARPDITPAQVVAGIPIVAELLHVFGVFDLSQAQQDSLGKTVTWAFALLGADAVIRLGRNLARRF